MHRRHLALAGVVVAVLSLCGVGVRQLQAGAGDGALASGARDPRLAAQRARLQARTPAQRQADVAARAQWQALSQAERRDWRERWQAWRQLSDADRALLRGARTDWLARSTPEQGALRARFDALDAGERRGWRLGPLLGAHWPRLQPLFGYVRPEERDPLLAVLHGCTTQELVLLERLAFSIAPQERAALRAELLRVPPAQRLPWLLQRVER